MIVSADASRTVAIFVFGNDMTVTAGGPHHDRDAAGLAGDDLCRCRTGPARRTRRPAASAPSSGSSRQSAGSPATPTTQPNDLRLSPTRIPASASGQAVWAETTRPSNGAATNAINNANTSLQRPAVTPAPAPPMPPAGPPRGPGN